MHSTIRTDSQAIDRLIQHVDRLHSGPAVAQRIVRLTRDPEFDMNEVVRCLDHDPALSARILRLVNSSHYGLAHKISSVRQAAIYLGRRSLRLTTLTFALIETLARGATGRLYTEYWRRTLTMATTASRLARLDVNVADDDAYTAGLLADVGVLVLAQVHGARYSDIHSRHRHGPELLEAEQEQLGFGHAVVGARLLEHWGLPAGVVDAVTSHHDPSPAGSPLSVAVRSGDLLADALWAPGSPHVPASVAFLKKAYGIDLDTFIDLAVACRKDVEESAALFGIDGCELPGCEELLDEARRLYSEASLEAAAELDGLETAIDDLLT